MTLDDLAGRTFATVQQAASILGADERTVRSDINAGKIPGTQVGVRWMVPTAWLRQQAGDIPMPPTAIDIDGLADKVAELVTARIFGVFATLAPNAAAAVPAPPGPAANVNDLPPAKAPSHAQATRRA